MLIPETANKNVVNKTVVYRDEIISMKDNNLKSRITKVSDINLVDLEKVVQVVLNDNPNAIFYMIQYSNKDKAVYFFTNDSITTKAWIDLKKFRYTSFFTSEDIANEIKRIFMMPRDHEVDNISLYEVVHFMKSKLYEYEHTKSLFQERFNRLIKSRYGFNNYVVVQDFDYQTMEMSILVNSKKISFIKKDGDLHISRSDSAFSGEILSIFNKDLFELYDFFVSCFNYKKQVSYGIPCINSCFNADISSYGVSISMRYDSNRKCFKLSAPSYTKGYTHYMYSPYIDDVLGTSEDELFKQLVVKIVDCPNWCQKELYDLRLSKLEKDREFANEMVLKRTKVQRRNEIKKKLFPFLKN